MGGQRWICWLRGVGGGDGRLVGRAGERGSPRGSGAGAATRGGATSPAPPPGSQRPPPSEPFFFFNSRGMGGGGIIEVEKARMTEGRGAAELKGRRAPS